MIEHQDHASTPRKRPIMARTGVGWVTVFALFTGMLFWAKLRLVQPIPRTAYAVPESVDTGESSSASENATGVGATPDGTPEVSEAISRD